MTPEWLFFLAGWLSTSASSNPLTACGASQADGCVAVYRLFPLDTPCNAAENNRILFWIEFRNETVTGLRRGKS